jgi:hypothetical protein
MIKSNKKETRDQKIKSYMRLSKKDLAIILVDTIICNEIIIKKLSK